MKWAPIGWRHHDTAPRNTAPRNSAPRKTALRRITERGHSLWDTAKASLAVLAIPLALLLIVQHVRFSYAINAAQASIETQQENIRYLADKLGALTHVGGDETSTSEIKNIEQRRAVNADRTLTLIKVIDVLPKQLSAKLTIAGRGEGILGITVRPLRFEGRTEYRGIVWQGPTDPSSLPPHHVEIEYPVGRYAVEVTSKDDDVTLDYKFER